MPFAIKYFGKMTQEQQDKILLQIEQDNAHLPQFSEKFRTMALFTVQKAMNKKTVDLFSFDPSGREMAIGYRIHVRNDRFFAEPWVWVVSNIDKNVGMEITQLDPNCLYFGTFVPRELIHTYGTSAYNVMFGNLRLLQQHSMRKISI
ncbi:hypothetical protein HOU08_gp108 [Dickeya phage vB_DsoM_JA29]|uniref:Uncharacterized protein n=1 Tax=Dickeya phage vB_DsoM_JA29 TaxID=2283031 RepID=A0A384ZX76_9CAUD|nr:hypothetical protein HOU08_gp108 [Dickeya phage vB_DsoM_JA29]AXG66834.1 hypothetical protein JA29_108 [Dickeya phage vB_DsoM_JA29]